MITDTLPNRGVSLVLVRSAALYPTLYAGVAPCRFMYLILTSDIFYCVMYDTFSFPHVVFALFDF